jgi:hypothetical protein
MGRLGVVRLPTKPYNFEPALEKARRFNERLDFSLTQTGLVDSKLFLDFASVQSDPSASSVGWLRAKLLVLVARVSTGAGLSLYEPSQNTSIPVNNISELVAWANKHFPIAEFKT